MNNVNFNRPPRVRLPSLRGEKIELPTPPAPPAAPEGNTLLALIPVLSVSMMAGFYVLRAVATPSGGGDALFAIPMIGVAAVAIAGALFAARWRRRSHQKKITDGQLAYLRAVENIRVRLEAANAAQLGILAADYPTPEDYLHLALTRDPRLWQRRPDDEDFASFRVGVGRVPSDVSIAVPLTHQEQPDMERALRLVEAYRFVDDAPVTVFLRRGTVGFYGRRSQVLRAVRAAVSHLVVSHSPEDLKVHLIASASHAEQWDWLRWLPHVRTQASQDSIAFDAEAIRQLMGGISQKIEERRAAGASASRTPHLLLIVDEMQLVNLEVTYGALLRDGAAWGASVLCIAPTFEALPGDCTSVIEVREDGFQYTLSQAGRGGGLILEGAQVDGISAHESGQIARALAGVRAVSAAQNDRVPAKVDYLELYQAATVEALRPAIKTRWSRAVAEGILPFPAPIGRENFSTITELWLDETHHGAHGMLAGTTGSGKSELLSALICSLAIEHHPRLLNFLLIDFKGGSAFAPFAQLPHTVGMVTNLDGGMVARTLAALKAETDARQAFLNRMNARDVTHYHRLYLTNPAHLNDQSYTPMPHLFIIVDEFAQLAKEMPDFMRELVRTAQVGRGLGLHLILGTQSPMDVITDEMNANLQFRICLRVPNVDASRAMLRRPDAAYIPADLPGRGYFQSGEQGIFKLFQTAHIGADYAPQRDDLIPDHGRTNGDDLFLEVLTNSGEKIQLIGGTVATQPYDSVMFGANRVIMAKAIADLLISLAREARIPANKAILLPPLHDRITLSAPFERIGAGGWTGERWLSAGRDQDGRPIPLGSAPIGLLDDPINRQQQPLWVHLGGDDNVSVPQRGVRRKEGHVLIVGAPGTGKTTAIRALAMSAALLYPPEKLNMYFVSFTGAGLDDLGRLPHAEKVIYGTETERVRRLFTRLITILEDRQAGRVERLPLIAVFIDQYEGFKEFTREHERLTSDFERLITEGRAAGIALVMVASSADAMADKLRSLISQRIALGVSAGDVGNYVTLIGRPSAPPDKTPPAGRGYVYHSPPLPCQIALPSMSQTVFSEAEALDQMGALIFKMRDVWEKTNGRARHPAAVAVLPRRVPLAELLSEKTPPSKTLITRLGKWDDDALSDYHLDWDAAGRGILVVGQPASGKTNTLYAAALAAAWAHPPSDLRYLLVDFDGRGLAELRSLKHVAGVANDPEELAQQLDAIRGSLSTSTGKVAIFIDNYDMVSDSLRATPEILTALRDLLRGADGSRVYLWAAGYLERASDPLIKYLLMRRAGFALMSKESLTRMNVRAVGISSEVMPVGRAYIPMQNKIGVAQLALVEDAESIITRVNGRWNEYDAATWGGTPIRAKNPAPFADIPVNDTVTEIDVAGLIDDLFGAPPAKPTRKPRKRKSP